MPKSVCKFCLSIANLKTFRERLKRKCLLRGKEVKAEEKVRYDFRDRSELIEALRAKNEKLEFYKKKSTLLQFEIERHKSSSKMLRKEIREITAKGTFGDVAATISRSVRKGMLKDKTGVINIITTIAKNLPKSQKDTDISQRKIPTTLTYSNLQ